MQGTLLNFFDWARIPRKPSGGTNTVETQSGPPPQVLANYQTAFNQAQNVTQQPFQSYGGSQIAGFTPQQTAAFNNINTASNSAQPFINSASQAATNAVGDAQPYLGQASTDANGAVSMVQPGQFGSTVSQYESPYTQQVVNATQAEFANQNTQQQQQVQGNTIAAGAFGGDRGAVAQAQTAGQEALAQAPVIAGLENTGYQNATTEANTAAGLGLTGAGTLTNLGNTAGNLDLSSSYSLGNLGNETQSTGLAGASAELQAGGLQQQLGQEELNVPYEQYLAGQAYPYQTTNYLTNVAEGTGSLSGGTSSTSSPGPSVLSQASGLGLAGLGIIGGTGGFGASGWLTGLLARGGAVPHRDSGGVVSGMSSLPDIISLDSLPTIPQMTASGMHNTIPSPPKPAQPQTPLGATGGVGNLSDLIKLLKNSGGNGSPTSLSSPTPVADGTSFDPSYLADNGFSPNGSGLAPSSQTSSRGGAIMPHHHAVQQIIRSLGGLGAIRSPYTQAVHRGPVIGLGRDLGGSVGGDTAALYAGLPTSTLQQMMAANPPTTPQGSLMEQVLAARQGNARDAGLSAPQGYADGGSTQVETPDFTDRYNTPLTPAEEAQYQTWGQQQAANGGRNPANDTFDYDMRGFWKSGGQFAGNGHAGDEYKKPNHPTFSTYSNYNGKDGYQGGQWSVDGQPKTFTPGPTNMQFQDKGDLQHYFADQEPDYQLVLPDGYRRGGLTAPQGYDDGGAVAGDGSASGPDLADWAIHDPNPPSGPTAGMGVDPDRAELPPTGDPSDVVMARLRKEAGIDDAPQAPAATPTTPNTGRAGDLLSGGDAGGDTGGRGTAYDAPAAYTPPPQPTAGLGMTVAPSQPAPDIGSHHKSDDFATSPWSAVLAAGLGMMSGTSKFPLVNIGQGGLAGLQALQSIPEQRTKQIQAEQAQDNLDAMRAMRSGLGIGAATPGSARAPGVAGLSAPSQGGVTAVGSNGQPLFNISSEYAAAQQMMMSGIPAYVDAGKAKLDFLKGLVTSGVVPTASGGVVPLPGDAEAKARALGMGAAAEAPYKVGEALASRAGTPVSLEPGKTIVSGADVMSPESRSLIDRAVGVGQPQSQQQPSGGYTASPYAAKTAQVEANGNPAKSDGNHVGLGQFDSGTWLQTIKTAYPQETRGLSDQQLLALRTNPQLSLQMTDALAQQNGTKLAAAGLPVNAASARLAHWFGADGAVRIATADTNTPIERLFDPQTVQRNGLSGKTAGDVVRGVVQQFGTAPLGGAPTPQRQPQGVQYAQRDTGTMTDAGTGSTNTSTLQPTAASVPSMINVTQFPGDLPPSQSMAGPNVVRNPDGSVTSSVSFAQRKAQEEAGAFIGKVPDETKKLNDSQLLLNGLHDEVAKNAAAPGWYQSGAGAGWRQDIAKVVNGTSVALGGKPLFDPTKVGDIEEFNKNSNVAAFSLARTMAGGRVALGEVTQANKAVPNMGNTPYGNIMVTHLLMQDNAHQADRLQYQADQFSRGVDPNVSGAQFDRMNPPARYVSAAGAAAVREAYPQVITALKSAPTPANIEAFNRRYGEGVAETLLRGQQ